MLPLHRLVDIPLVLGNLVLLIAIRAIVPFLPTAIANSISLGKAGLRDRDSGSSCVLLLLFVLLLLLLLKLLIVPILGV